MTPRVRTLVYALLMAVLGVATAMRLVTPDQGGVLEKVINAALDLVTAIMLMVAAQHVTPDGVSSLRKAVYVLTGAVFAAAAALGWAIPAGIQEQAYGVLAALGGAALSVATYMSTSSAARDYDPKRVAG